MPLDALNRLLYIANRLPVCPHCDEEIDVGDNDLYRIYEEGEHQVDCPQCDQPFMVSTRISHSFSTDKQPELGLAQCRAIAAGIQAPATSAPTTKDTGGEG